MRGLAAGGKDYAEARKTLQEKFVFLNVYCTSVDDEHEPRGPEGPFRFQDKSVPVLVIKRSNGETIVQQLGFISDAEQAKKRLQQILDKAVKDHGPITTPKTLRPLLKAFDAAEKLVEKKRPAQAWVEFTKVVALGADTKVFTDGPPTLALTAASRADEILAAAEKAVDEVIAGADDDAKKAVASLRRALSNWGAIPSIKERLLEAIRRHTEAKDG